MTIFRDFRALVAAVRELVSVLEQAVQAHREIGPAVDRIGSLELSRHKFEAMMEGMLLKADGKLKAASNAEARERQLKRSYEKQLLDRFDSDGEQGAEEPAVLGYDAAAGEGERVPALRLDVAPNNKAAAVRAKFGL